MADTVLQTAELKKSQLQQNEQQNSQAESTNAQKIKAKLTRFVSYFSGDMAPFGKWMKGTVGFTWSSLLSQGLLNPIKNNYIKKTGLQV